MGIFDIFRRVRRPSTVPAVDPATLKSMLAECVVPERCDTDVFVASALRAAEGTQSGHRRVILTDVAGVLACDAGELDFLFLEPVIAANDSDPVVLPDYRTALHAELTAVAL